MVPIQKDLTTRNFTKGRPVLYGIFHTEVDLANDTQRIVADWMNDLRDGSSAHYLVGLDGSIIQAVDEADTAWHAANWRINVTSIGIEHEDNGKPLDPVRSNALYESSAQLVADICRRYNIPCKLVLTGVDHMPVERGWLRHRQVSLLGTACPDGLDCERIIKRANEILNGG